LSLCFGSLASAKDKVIGVSWSNFQEERWKTDEAAIKAVVAAAGDKYISADAQSSAQKQLTDIESLITQGGLRQRRVGAPDTSRRPRSTSGTASPRARR
jgi:D-xylose transport system substrate-binding protein